MGGEGLAAKGVAISLDLARHAKGAVFRHLRQCLARHGLVVEIKLTLLNLDAVARQADQALDVVGLAVAGQLEDDDVAPVRPPRCRKRPCGPGGLMKGIESESLLQP